MRGLLEEQKSTLDNLSQPHNFLLSSLEKKEDAIQDLTAELRSTKKQQGCAKLS